MAVPKNRHTKSRRDRRRAHIKLSPVNMVQCEKCTAPARPHFIREVCGTYKGREAVDVLKKITKRDKKRQEQAESQQQQQAQPT